MGQVDEDKFNLLHVGSDPERGFAHDNIPPSQRGWPKSAIRHDFLKTSLITVLAASPTIYIWSMPLLAEWCQNNFMHTRASTTRTDSQCFVYKCDGYPYCSDSDFGATVSSFISTPPATALFAAVFAWPLSYLWYIQHDIDGDWLCFITMMCYQISFGLFTTCNTYYFAELHGMTQNATGLFGFLHYCLLARHCNKTGFRKCLAVLILLLLSTWTFSFLFYAPWWLNIRPKDISPWLCFRVEACGLSLMSIFPWVWELEKKRARSQGS